MFPLGDRITIDPEICHGKPCIRGLRYPVDVILKLLSSGMTIEDILADYEYLEREDIFAALALAKGVVADISAHSSIDHILPHLVCASSLASGTVVPWPLPTSRHFGTHLSNLDLVGLY
jgi:uncharacterized protein (DUF433 family)